MDTNNSRPKLAQTLGATHIVNPAEEDVVARLNEITCRASVDEAADFLGVLSIINSIIESIGARGTVPTKRDCSHDCEPRQ